MPAVSIIIRTKNEERWIGRCLRMVYKQDFEHFDVILVDNRSTDRTLHIASKYPVKILHVDDYAPGKAVNIGVRASEADYFACLSAHCIPKDETWLSTLHRNINEDAVAGVYGRQLPFSYSSDLDKRDLLITFGMDRRVQIKDSFFHNANSLVRRSVWNGIPFDETATNIEDRIWGKAVVDAGHRIVYEPEASVYHHHGIHQDRDERRVRNIVRIMESIDGLSVAEVPHGFDAQSMKTVAIIPVFGEPKCIGDRDLLKRAIEHVQMASHIDDIVLIAEDPAALETAQAHNVRCVVRPVSLMEPQVSVEDVLTYALDRVEEGRGCYDAVMYINYLYPFRPKGFCDHMVERFSLSGVDSLVPTIKDYQPYWTESHGRISPGEEMLAPRDFKAPLQRGVVGLGCVTSSEFVRRGKLFGDNVGLVPLEEPLYAIKVSNPFASRVAELAFEKGEHLFQKQGGDEQ